MLAVSFVSFALAFVSSPPPALSLALLHLGEETPEERATRLASSALITLRANFDDVPPADGTKAKIATLAYPVQPAVLVGDDGLALTNLSIFRGPASIESRAAGESTWRPVELLASDPSRDLALVRLPSNAQRAAVPASGPSKDGARSTTPASRGCELGAQDGDGKIAWTLVPGFDELAHAERCDAVERAPHRGLSGAPVLDERGTLVGLWRWSANEGVETPRRIDLEDVRTWLGSSVDSPKVLRSRLQSGATVPALSFPRLDWKTRTESSSNARKRAKDFADQVECKGNGCGDDGAKRGQIVKRGRKMESKEKYGKDDLLIDCPACKAVGLQDDDGVWRALRELATKILPNEPDDAIAEGLMEGVGLSAKIHPAEFHRRLQACPPASMVPLTNATPGRAVAFSISFQTWEERRPCSADAKDFLVVDRRLGRMIVRAPKQKSVGVGEEVVILGAIAGFLADPAGETTVLERCYVVPIHLP